MYKKYLIFIITYLFLFTDKVNANCNFKTADYIEELELTSIIKEIGIEIPDSRKFVKNSMKILLEDSLTINPKFRKKYDSTLNVKYPFGTCSYNAKVWQNGDLKDHIRWNKNYPLTSLNVRMEQGNILNAVKFKLLIPETRNGLNEILGTLILRQLGFIAPETFETVVSINGHKSLMIFQEDSRKELLERHKRREGPIFEGDESILWGNNWLTFEELSLSRLINWKWFLKGRSSQIITLNSLADLQQSYLPSYQLEGNVINPNFRAKSNFEDYYFMMSVMGGQHALRPHNRKFYFNSLENSFEPIYYDGNFNLNLEIDLGHNWLSFSNAFSENYIFPFSREINNKEFYNQLLSQFKSRVIKFNQKKLSYFNESLKNISTNTNILIKHLKNIQDFNIINSDYLKSRNLYKQLMNKKNLKQNIIKEYDIFDDNVMITKENNEKNILSLKDFSQIISKNYFNNERYIFLPINKEKFNYSQELTEVYVEELNGFLIFTPNISLNIDSNNKEILIRQMHLNSWVLFKDVKLSDWDIRFEGINIENRQINNQQRFNKYGITGCLNFYKTVFDKSSLRMIGGGCEDGINIIQSKGLIKLIEVKNSFQDSIDLDFSDLKINFISVDSSGNDCFDVSGGNYILDKAYLNRCMDKGLSIGEKSRVEANNTFITNSNIGISVKDLSIVNLGILNMSNNKICIEAKQKKQEFGGGRILLKSSICESSKIFIDEHSNMSKVDYYEL